MQLFSLYKQLLDDCKTFFIFYFFKDVRHHCLIEKYLCSICLSDFLYFRCLVQPKMMVNGNHFQFDHKSLSNSEKTIYGFKNRKSFFSRFKLFILADTFMGIRHRQALEFVGSLNLPSKVPKFWYLIARF
jgi:hypothetical protein